MAKATTIARRRLTCFMGPGLLVESGGCSRKPGVPTRSAAVVIPSEDEARDAQDEQLRLGDARVGGGAAPPVALPPQRRVEDGRLIEHLVTERALAGDEQVRLVPHLREVALEREEHRGRQEYGVADAGRRQRAHRARLARPAGPAVDVFLAEVAHPRRA